MRNSPRASMEFDKELSESWVAATEAMRSPRMVTVWSFSSLPLPTLMTVTWRMEASTEFSATDFSCVGARQTASRSAKYRSFTFPPRRQRLTCAGIMPQAAEFIEATVLCIIKYLT